MRETKRSVPRIRQPQEIRKIPRSASGRGASRTSLIPHSYLFSLTPTLTLLPLPSVPRILKRLLGGGVLASDAGYRLDVLVGGRAL